MDRTGKEIIIMPWGFPMNIFGFSMLGENGDKDFVNWRLAVAS